MKKLISFTLILFTVPILSLIAQETEFYPIEKVMTFDGNTAPAWTVTVGENHTEIKKAFIKYCKDRYKVKLKAKGKTNLEGEQVNLPDVSDKDGDLKVALFSEAGKYNIAVAFFLGYDIPVNSKDYPMEMNRLRSFTENFAIYYNTQYFSNILDDNNKRLKDLTSELKSSEKEIKNLNKKIENIEDDILKIDDADKKFDLSNKNVENRARVQTLSTLVDNLKQEIAKINLEVESTKVSLRKLEVQSIDN